VLLRSGLEGITVIEELKTNCHILKSRSMKQLTTEAKPLHTNDMCRRMDELVWRGQPVFMLCYFAYESFAALHQSQGFDVHKN